MVASKTYYGQPGLWYFYDPAIANAEILKVAREGTVHHPTGNETIGSLEFVYTAATGAIEFDMTNPFSGLFGSGRPNRSYLTKIQVVYRF